MASVECERKEETLNAKLRTSVIVLKMFIRAKTAKIVYVAVVAATVLVAFFANRFYVVQLDKGSLQSSNRRGFAIIEKSFSLSSFRSGDMALLEFRGTNDHLFHFVRALEKPPEALTGQFSYIEYYANTVSPPNMIRGPCSNDVIRGRVLCIIKVP